MIFREHANVRHLLTAVFGSPSGLQWREQVGDGATAESRSATCGWEEPG